jgi:hypothetical protein
MGIRLAARWLNLNDWTKRIGWKKGQMEWNEGKMEKSKEWKEGTPSSGLLKRADGSKGGGQDQMNFRSPVSLPNSILAKLKIARKK